MKIIIEPETDDEKKQRESIEIKSITEFALVGRGFDGISYFDIQHSHVGDKYKLVGDIEQMKLRILHGTGH